MKRDGTVNLFLLQVPGKGSIATWVVMKDWLHLEGDSELFCLTEIESFANKPHSSMCMEFRQTSAHIVRPQRPHECCRDSLNMLEYEEPLRTKSSVSSMTSTHNPWIFYLFLASVDSWWCPVPPCRNSRQTRVTTIQTLRYYPDQLDLVRDARLKYFSKPVLNCLPINWALVESTRRKNFSSLSGLMKTSSSARRNHSNLSI